MQHILPASRPHRRSRRPDAQRPLRVGVGATFVCLYGCACLLLLCSTRQRLLAVAHGDACHVSAGPIRTMLCFANLASHYTTESLANGGQLGDNNVDKNDPKRRHYGFEFLHAACVDRMLLLPPCAHNKLSLLLLSFAVSGFSGGS